MGTRRRGGEAPQAGQTARRPGGRPYLLLAVVDAHPALLDHQGLVDLQEAAGPHEAVHGRQQAGLRRSPAPALGGDQPSAGQPAAPPGGRRGGGRAGRAPGTVGSCVERPLAVGPPVARRERPSHPLSRSGADSELTRDFEEGQAARWPSSLCIILAYLCRFLVSVQRVATFMKACR